MFACVLWFARHFHSHLAIWAMPEIQPSSTSLRRGGESLFPVTGSLSGVSFPMLPFNERAQPSKHSISFDK